MASSVCKMAKHAASPQRSRKRAARAAGSVILQDRLGWPLCETECSTSYDRRGLIWQAFPRWAEELKIKPPCAKAVLGSQNAGRYSAPCRRCSGAPSWATFGVAPQVSVHLEMGEGWGCKHARLSFGTAPTLPILLYYIWGGGKEMHFVYSKCFYTAFQLGWGVLQASSQRCYTFSDPKQF